MGCARSGPAALPSPGAPRPAATGPTRRCRSTAGRPRAPALSPRVAGQTTRPSPALSGGGAHTAVTADGRAAEASLCAPPAHLGEQQALGLEPGVAEAVRAAVAVGGGAAFFQRRALRTSAQQQFVTALGERQRCADRAPRAAVSPQRRPCTSQRLHVPRTFSVAAAICWTAPWRWGEASGPKAGPGRANVLPVARGPALELSAPQRRAPGRC